MFAPALPAQIPINRSVLVDAAAMTSGVERRIQIIQMTTKWEYILYTHPTDFEPSMWQKRENFTSDLNKLGAEGWELVCETPLGLVYKRPAVVQTEPQNFVYGLPWTVSLLVIMVVCVIVWVAAIIL